MSAVAFIDSGAHPLASDFYQRCPDEPIGTTGSIHVTAREPMPGLSVESLLRRMASLGGGDDALVVCHGTPQGLSIPLLAGAAPRRGATSAQILGEARILAVVLGTSTAGGASRTTTDEDAASMLMTDTARVATLRGLMEAVQARHLNHVALRACNLGQSPANMATVKAFFGARSLSAPDQPDSYGPGNAGSPTIDEGVWARWRAEHPHRFEYPTGPLGGRFAVSPHQQRVRLAIMADSAQVVERWVGAHLPPGANQSPFIWHALWWGLPPTFSGEPEYRTHIVSV